MAANKARVRKLVEALRSGTYKQGSDTLARIVSAAGDVEFCCLGVACEVARKDGLLIDKRLFQGRDGSTRYLYDSSSGYLPASVQDYYGFADRDPELGDYSATHCNDVIKFSFSRIADLFEQNYLTKETETDDSE